MTQRELGRLAVKAAARALAQNKFKNIRRITK
jgi:hypothetical protein